MGPDMSAFGLDREGRKDKTTETVIMRQSGSSQQRSPRNETADVLDWKKVNKSRWELVWWGGLGTDAPGEIFSDKTCRCREKQIPFNWPQVFDPKPPRAIKWNRPQKQWKRNALVTGPPTVHQVWQYNQVKVGHRQEFSPREAKHWTLLGVVLMSQDTTTSLEPPSPLQRTPAYFPEMQRLNIRLSNFHLHLLILQLRAILDYQNSLTQNHFENIAKGTTGPRHWVLWFIQLL